jgi:hypothetical protein
MNRLSKEGHIVEELNGVRCSIVEKNVSPERVEFLKNILEINGHEVIVSQTPAPPVKKRVASPHPPPTEGAVKVSPGGTTESREQSSLEGVTSPTPVAPNTFTVGVTNISFHPMLAVYERSLYTETGKPATIAYWNQEDEVSGQLYWERRKV